VHNPKFKTDGYIALESQKNVYALRKGLTIATRQLNVGEKIAVKIRTVEGIKRIFLINPQKIK